MGRVVADALLFQCRMRFLESRTSCLGANDICKKRAESGRTISFMDESRKTPEGVLAILTCECILFVDQSSSPVAEFPESSSTPASASSAESLSPSKPSNASASD